MYALRASIWRSTMSSVATSSLWRPLMSPNHLDAALDWLTTRRIWLETMAGNCFMHRHRSDLTCRHLTMILMSWDCSKSKHPCLLAAFQILYLLLSFYAIIWATSIGPLLYVLFLFSFDISALEKVLRLYIWVGNCDSVGTNLILIGEFSPFFPFSTFQK